MPRRHNRRETVPPLDLTPEDIKTAPQPIRPGQRIKSRAERETEQAEAQQAARIRKGIDWRYCLVPGCGEQLKFYGLIAFRHKEHRDPNKILPLCVRHELIVWQVVQRSKGHPDYIAASEALKVEQDERDARLWEERKAARKARRDGHIYFLRLNGLIKAGWSSELRGRLKAYGPDVEVLCHYPGTRDDETDLHRTLRPFLAKGREWYRECQLIDDLVAAAIKQHGPPYITATWTEPKPDPIKRRRSA